MSQQFPRNERHGPIETAGRAIRTIERHNSVGDAEQTVLITLARMTCIDGEYVEKDASDPLPGYRVQPEDLKILPKDQCGRPIGSKFGAKCGPKPSRTKAVDNSPKSVTPIPEPVTVPKLPPRGKKAKRDWINVGTTKLSDRNSIEILHTVAKISGFSLNMLRGPARHQPVVHWRMIAAYLIRKHRGTSLPFIGRLLGDRDHSTIIHSIRKVEDNPDKFAADIAKVEGMLT